MGHELVGLEITHGLREKISDVYQNGGPVTKTEDNKEEMTALGLMMQLLTNVESFPEVKFGNLREALDRAGSTLSAFRKAVFVLHAFAFEFAIGNSVRQGNADMRLIRSRFISECVDFIAKSPKYVDAPETFLADLALYGTAVSDSVKDLGGSAREGNILVPIENVFYISVFGCGAEEFRKDVGAKEAKVISDVAGQVIHTFLPLVRHAHQQLRASGVIG